MRNFAAVGSTEFRRRRARCLLRTGVGEIVYFVCVCVCVVAAQRYKQNVHCHAYIRNSFMLYTQIHGNNVTSSMVTTNRC